MLGNAINEMTRHVEDILHPIESHELGEPPDRFHFFLTRSIYWYIKQSNSL